MIKHHISPAQFAAAPKKSIRDAFGEALVELGRTQRDVVAVCADLEESVRMSAFAEAFPDRFFELGVAEQNMAGIAAGLAKEGLCVFAGSFAAFSPGRNFDQIRTSICYAPRSVVLVGGHAGLATGPDGATHQMLEDLAMMRALPNMFVAAPSDAGTTQALVEQLATRRQPAYLRLSRIATRDLILASSVRWGEAIELRDGTDVTLLTTGVLADRALEVAFALETAAHISAAVIMMPSIKPLDTGALQYAARRTGRLVTLEEHQRAGGFGSAVAEYMVQQMPVPMEIIGVQDIFGESGEADELWDAYGFSVPTLLQRIRQFVA